MNTPIQVRFPDEELDAIDDYRRKQKNPPSRAQAIRELLRPMLMGDTVMIMDRLNADNYRALAQQCEDIANEPINNFSEEQIDVLRRMAIEWRKMAGECDVQQME